MTMEDAWKCRRRFGLPAKYGPQITAGQPAMWWPIEWRVRKGAIDRRHHRAMVFQESIQH